MYTQTVAPHPLVPLSKVGSRYLDVPLRTLTDMAKKGRLPGAVQVGTRWFVSEAALQALVATATGGSDATA